MERYYMTSWKSVFLEEFARSLNPDGIPEDVKPVLVIDPEDREQIAALIEADDDAALDLGSNLDRITRVQETFRRLATGQSPRCGAHVNIAGADFRCVESEGHGDLPHRNPDAEAVWG